MYLPIALRAAQAAVVLFLISTSMFAQGETGVAEAVVADAIPSRQMRPSPATTPNDDNLIEVLTLRMQHSPDDWRIQNRLAVEYSNRGEHSLALPLLDSAASLAPRNPGIYYNLAVIYERLGRPEDAFSTIMQSLSINPASSNAQRMSCDLRVVLKRYGEAAKCYGSLTATNPRDANFYASYSLALAYSGAAELALKTAEDGIAAFPDEPVIINCFGIAYFVSKDFRRSVEQFQRVIRLDPGYSMARLNLALAALMSNDRTTAYEQYKVLRDSDQALARRLKDEIDRKYLVTVDGRRNVGSSLK